MNTRRKPRGWLLAEAMVAIGLLSIFMLLTAQIISSITRYSYETQTQQSREAQVDTALRQLRADVWAAAKVDAPNRNELRLWMPDGSVMQWRTRGMTALRTAILPAASDERNWADLGLQMSFGIHGSAVVIGIDERIPGPREEVVLPCELLQLGRRAE